MHTARASRKAGARQTAGKIRRREAINVKFHQRILQWQADHPNITWLVWGIVWLIVLILLFRPGPIGAA